MLTIIYIICLLHVRLDQLGYTICNKNNIIPRKKITIRMIPSLLYV